MDFNDIWQEHKGFILSIIIGVIAFFVAFTILDQDTTSLERGIRAATRKIQTRGQFDAKARSLFVKEGKALDERLDQDKKLIYFKIRPEFDISKESRPERRYLELQARVTQRVADDCNRSNVSLDSRKGAQRVGLPQASPVEKEVIQRTLIGLDQADRTIGLLLAAGDQALEKDSRAKGLISLERVSIDPGSGTRGRSRKRRKGESDLDMVKVQFKFRCGSSTLANFLRSAVSGETMLQFSSFKASFPKKSEEVLLVEMTIASVLEREEEE